MNVSKSETEKEVILNPADLAFEAFRNAEDKEGLGIVGQKFLEIPDVLKAKIAFTLAENKEMTEFLNENF